MRLNPEIQRNLWLEFSLHRLLAMPVVLALIFFIASKLDSASKITQPFMMVETAAGTLFFLLVKIWGGHKAAESVIEEVNDNTWDFQKLSALSPWDLTVGKLFGGPSYSWYGGAIAYAVAVIAGSFHWSSYETFLFAASLLLDGLLVHATALFTSLIAIQNRNGAHNKMRVLPYHLAGLGLSSIFTSSLLGYGGWINNLNHPNNDIKHLSLTWYGLDFEIMPFMVITSTILLTWLVAGIYWQMRNQMRMRTGPLLWLGFVVFWLAYSAGFEPPASHQWDKAKGILTFLLSLGFLYTIAFQEGWTTVRYRRFLGAWQEKNYGKALEICPRWLLTFPICVALGLWSVVSNFGSPAALFVVALLCFASRDLALLHVFKFNPSNRRPEKTAFFYMAIAYVLLPFLFGVLHFYHGLALFLPDVTHGDTDHLLDSTFSGALQALVVIYLAFQRWFRFGAKTE